jgi:hypothetical protein
MHKLGYTRTMLQQHLGKWLAKCHSPRSLLSNRFFAQSALKRRTGCKVYGVYIALPGLFVIFAQGRLELDGRNNISPDPSPVAQGRPDEAASIIPLQLAWVAA